MKRISTISLVIAAAFGSAAAQAEVVSNAWLGTLSIQLIDLDENDGIAPSITPSGQAYTGVYGYAYDTAANNYQYFNAITSGSANTAISQISSQITGVDPTVDGTQTSSGSAIGPTASPGNYGHYYGYTQVYNYFTLSANTQVIFSADASTSATSNAPYNGGADYEYAYAQSYLYGYLYNSAFAASDSLYSQGYSSYNGTYNPDTGQYEYENISDSQSRTLTVSFSNPFAEAVAGYLFGQTYVSGYSYSDYQPPSEVPVPAALPLMASAFGLFGLTRRKSLV